MGLNIDKKLFDLNTSSDKLYRLTYKDDCFVPLEISLDEDTVHMHFDTDGFSKGESILALPLVEKLRFLINCYKLSSKKDEFVFSLDLSNLVYDINLLPRIIERDLLADDETENFFSKYKALTASVLYPKFSYDNYLNSGEGLYKKKKSVSNITTATDSENLMHNITNAYKKEAQRISKNEIMVNKKANTFVKFLLPFTVICMVLSLVFSGYLYFQKLPFQNAIILSDKYFLSEDYDNAIRALDKIPAQKLPKESKYQLAKAFVVSESLSPEQKENILKGITLKSTDMLLEYWIYIGRLDYEMAVDTAQRIGDDDLLIYALMKYKLATQNNNKLSGVEKAEKLESLSSQIDKLQKNKESLINKA